MSVEKIAPRRIREYLFLASLKTESGDTSHYFIIRDCPIGQCCNNRINAIKYNLVIVDDCLFSGLEKNLKSVSFLLRKSMLYNSQI